MDASHAAARRLEEKKPATLFTSGAVVGDLTALSTVSCSTAMARAVQTQLAPFSPSPTPKAKPVQVGYYPTSKSGANGTFAMPKKSGASGVGLLAIIRAGAEKHSCFHSMSVMFVCANPP